MKSHPAANPTPSPAPPAGGAERFAWAMYDFANSGYATVVLTAVFNAYFVGVIATGAGLATGPATALWTIAVALGNAIVLASAPVVGAIADRRAAKKTGLMLATAGCVLSTALLALAGPGDVVLAMALVVVSFVMFATGDNLVAAFLPEIAPAERMGRVSGLAWGIGYLGGLWTLGLCLLYVTWAQERGHAAHDYVPVTLLITAATFALASCVTFAGLRERAVASLSPTDRSDAREAIDRLRTTLREARRFTDLFRFLLSLVVYQAGISTVFVVAAIYAQEALGFEADALIALVLVVNVTAAAGALAMGHLQDRLGSRVALSLALGLWLIALLLVLDAGSPARVWLGANLIGIAMGACQAGGRALVGRFTPPARTAEFFGLWGLAVNLAAIVGPLTYGAISLATDGDHRLALQATTGFFVVGLALLWRVDERRGLRAAQGPARRAAPPRPANGA